MEKKLKIIETWVKIINVIILIFGVYCFDWKWLILYGLIIIHVVLLAFLVKYK